MTADEVLEALKGKISDYYYDALKTWLRCYGTHGIFKTKTKFEVRPTVPSEILRGYFVRIINGVDFIAVYQEPNI
jgi:hypothetical protein